MSWRKKKEPPHEIWVHDYRIIYETSPSQTFGRYIVQCKGASGMYHLMNYVARGDDLEEMKRIADEQQALHPEYRYRVWDGGEQG